jgi:hypothetical protein
MKIQVVEDILKAINHILWHVYNTKISLENLMAIKQLENVDDIRKEWEEFNRILEKIIMDLINTLRQPHIYIAKSMEEYGIKMFEKLIRRNTAINQYIDRPYLSIEERYPGMYIHEFKRCSDHINTLYDHINDFYDKTYSNTADMDRLICQYNILLNLFNSDENDW